MSHVLAIALGPVQEFIAAARKARDLWAGSQMLSDCSRAAARALQEGGAELVFPSSDDLARGASVVNKIVAIVQDGDNPKKLAEAARTAAQDVLTEQKVNALKTVGEKRAGGAVDAKLLTAQVQGFLEFYAAWYPFHGDESYDGARADADRLLAGRKALRDFEPPPASPGRQKSALDPSRESVLLTLPRSDPTHSARLQQLARLQIRPTEFLDGISLVKRTANLQQFVSVSRVAVDPFVRRLERDRPADLEALRGLAEELANARDEETPVQRLRGNQTQLSHFQAFRYDTQLFYDEEPLEGFTPGKEVTTAELFQKLVRDLRGPGLNGLKIGEIPPYFAILVADGDRMGAAISALGEPKKHEALSQALAGFAERAEGTVARHSGALIYSGGDDVLAFLPLDKALGCADALREAFADALGGLGLEQPPTLSVGVSIGHFGTSLDRLLDWGRQAEKKAKTLRNALAVTLHTRSSGEAGISAVASWGEAPVTARWGHWVGAYREDAVPAGLAYKLRGLAREVAEAAEHGHNTTGLLAAEVKRLLEKSRSRRGTAKIEEEFGDAIVRLVGENPKQLEQVVTELLIARHLARAQEIAEGPRARGRRAMSDGTFSDLLLRPRDPILLRDGRPFSAEPGARARTLPWPLPHTLAGALRTHVGNAQGFDWEADGPARARGLHLRGPLLATQGGADAWQILVPSPRDAVFLDHQEGEPHLMCLRPLPEMPPGAGTLSPSEGLHPMEITNDRKPKPTLAFWPLDRVVDWLSKPGYAVFDPGGAEALPTETRTFVQIDPATQTGQMGRLFSADLLCFADFAAGKTPAQALLCRLTGAEGLPSGPRFLPLGGERRLATVSPADGVTWPQARDFPTLTAALTGAKQLRLQLVTPALFVGGWKPGWLEGDPNGLTGEVPGVPGLRVTLAGATVGRLSPISGWDLQARRPKPLRHAAPAGSVYFFEVEGTGLSAEQAESLFLWPVNDRPEDDADGFGLALPGVW